VVGIDELVQKMARFGRSTKAIELAYQHIPAVATEEKKATNKEFLVVGWDARGVERLKGEGMVGTEAGLESGGRVG
jgi:hypothetical protein